MEKRQPIPAVEKTAPQVNFETMSPEEFSMFFFEEAQPNDPRFTVKEAQKMMEASFYHAPSLWQSLHKFAPQDQQRIAELSLQKYLERDRNTRFAGLIFEQRHNQNIDFTKLYTMVKNHCDDLKTRGIGKPPKRGEDLSELEVLQINLADTVASFGARVQFSQQDILDAYTLKTEGGSLESILTQPDTMEQMDEKSRETFFELLASKVRAYPVYSDNVPDKIIMGILYARYLTVYATPAKLDQTIASAMHTRERVLNVAKNSLGKLLLAFLQNPAIAEGSSYDLLREDRWNNQPPENTQSKGPCNGRIGNLNELIARIADQSERDEIKRIIREKDPTWSFDDRT